MGWLGRHSLKLLRRNRLHRCGRAEAGLSKNIGLPERGLGKLVSAEPALNGSKVVKDHSIRLSNRNCGKEFLGTF